MVHGPVIRLRVSIGGRGAISRVHPEHVERAYALLDSEHNNQPFVCILRRRIKSLSNGVIFCSDSHFSDQRNTFSGDLIPCLGFCDRSDDIAR
jgi:hypothetical protein